MFEPLVGELFRSGFVMQVAALHGDFVTPTVMGAGESDAAREQRGARALFRMLADDEAHGAENKATHAGLAGRAGRRRPSTRPAQLQPIWSQISEKVVRFEDSLERSRGRLESLLATSDSRPRRRSRHDVSSVRWTAPRRTWPASR